MARPLPDNYRQLGQYAVRFAPGAAIYEQGAVPDYCYVVLRGVVHFEALDLEGQPAVVASAQEGELVGHVAAFSGRPTSATARAAGEAIILAIPLAELLEAFRVAPELALELVRAFADPDSTSPAFARPEPAVTERPIELPPEPAPVEVDPLLMRLTDEFDPQLFFVDVERCPVSGTEFQYLRVRTRAVRPISRDSDFFVRYRSLDPTQYSVIVCPGCGYAAYRDDFRDLSEEERRALHEASEARLAMMQHSLAGLRSQEDAVRVTELALASYALRRANERRRAALLHRRAWIERERGDAAAERQFLEAARDAYRAAFERDSAITDESAMRAAYIIGDLTLRLGDPMAASRWLETATHFPNAKQQTGLIRMARERLYDARQMLGHTQDARRAG